MDASDSILHTAITLGPVRGIRVRISVLMFVAIMALMWRLESLPLGALAGAVLLLSVLLHQLAQLFVAHASGHELTDIVAWPLGGLTTQAADAGFPTQAQVQVVGPVLSLATGAVAWFQLQHMGYILELTEFVGGFRVIADEPLSITALRMICFASALLLTANLLPVMPFDGGRMLSAFLSERYDRVEVQDVMVRLGLVVSLLGLLVGFVFDQSAVVALASFVLILHLHEAGVRSAQPGYFEVAQANDDWQEDSSDADADMEGVESFRSSEDADTDELIARSSMMARRRARRESDQQRREAEERRLEEQQLDAILERIHREGEECLNPAERQLLRKASQRLKGKSKTPRPNPGQ